MGKKEIDEGRVAMNIVEVDGVHRWAVCGDLEKVKFSLLEGLVEESYLDVLRTLMSLCLK